MRKLCRDFFFFLNQMNFLTHLTAKGFLETQTDFTIINWCLMLTDYPIKKKKKGEYHYYKMSCYKK